MDTAIGVFTDGGEFLRRRREFRARLIHMGDHVVQFVTHHAECCKELTDIIIAIGYEFFTKVSVGNIFYNIQ